MGRKEIASAVQEATEHAGTLLTAVLAIACVALIVSGVALAVAVKARS